jgi:hypothetical protein
MMTGLEILDNVAYGHTLFHRDHDAWDVLDSEGLVCAVLCSRTHHLSISPLPRRVPPVPAGRRNPYREKVEWKITAETVEEGIERPRDLVRRSVV